MENWIHYFEDLFIKLEQVYVKMEPYWFELTLIVLFMIIAYIADRKTEKKTAS